MINEHTSPFYGLSRPEVESSRLRDGTNVIDEHVNAPLWKAFIGIVTEPMFLLLIACAVIYLITGEISEASFMIGATIAISAISFYQDVRSTRALQALQQYTQPTVSVLREGLLVRVPSIEIVVGDYIVAAEGQLIVADGNLVQAHDLSVNESLLTGEAFSVAKEVGTDSGSVYRGTLVVSGQCVYTATAVGIRTRLGQLGAFLDTSVAERTPLQIQIATFVRKMAIAGVFVFALIWGMDLLRNGDIVGSLLKGLTIAMSVLPEEIPVAFATFMALGAYRLMKSGVIVRQTGTVESLGSATILCTDKTGTITENSMEIFQCYAVRSRKTYPNTEFINDEVVGIIEAAMWASESTPFDPMERAVHQLYSEISPVDERPQFTMVHEYPLEGKPPMMTHAFENASGRRIIACKGAPEGLVEHSTLTPEQRQRLLDVYATFGSQGLRVLAVGTAHLEGNLFPDSQTGFTFDILGLVAFHDPPKKNIASVFSALYDAGLVVKVITGDNAQTAVAISRQAGLRGWDQAIGGAELQQMSEAEFDEATMRNNIFSRIFPELKLRIIESLKRQNQIVGMTGDGVNDAPALKAAHIGIAMGKRGAEIAKAAAALVLVDDDLGRMVDAIAMGRRIYANLKKAVQYIVSIHIPIILTVAIPSLLGWTYPAILTPIHVIFLELIMGPTCSIVYENEPSEPDSMKRPPRALTHTLFSMRELLVSIVQGLGITAGTLSMYGFCVYAGYGEELTRSMVFSTLVMANILLTYTNRSFHYSILTTLTYKNGLLLAITSVTVIVLVLMLYVPGISVFFRMAPPAPTDILWCAVVAMVSVIGFEFYKLAKRLRSS